MDVIPADTWWEVKTLHIKGVTLLYDFGLMLRNSLIFFFLEHWILPPGKSRVERIQEHGCYCLTLSSKDSQISLQKEFELFIYRIQLRSLDFDNVIASWDRPGVVAGKMLVIPETQDMGNSLNLSCFLY